MGEFDYSGIEIDQSVLDYFASSPLGPICELRPVAGDQSHPLFERLSGALNAVPGPMVIETQLNEKFDGLYGNLEGAASEWQARLWILTEEIHRRNQMRRRAILLEPKGEGRPEPYSDVDLQEIDLSDESLVSISDFHVDQSVLLRGNSAYVVLPTTPSENSSHWLTVALSNQQVRGKAKIRLDPLIKGEGTSFPRLSYRMLWWGPPLTWRDVENIERRSFGRWRPASLGCRSEFTDYVVEARGDELHLKIEEMPKREDLSISSARYLHAVFSRRMKSVIHLDGAIRVYSESEWDIRTRCHLHEAGKAGTRIKIFRVDGPVDICVVSALGGNFMVWNYDVARFFGAEIPDYLILG